MSQRFTREQRLLGASDFRRVFEQPLKSSDGYFAVLARPRESSQDPARLGLAIAKKQLKRAVDRNRIKRLVREYFRCSDAVNPAFDYVVMTRSRVKQVANSNLNQALHAHFLKIAELAVSKGDSGDKS